MSEMESKSAVRIRRATPADIPAMLSLVNEAFAVETFFITGDRTSADDLQQLMNTGCFLAAESDGGIRGSVYIQLRETRGYIGMLAVHPQSQRQGLGRLLIGAAENYLREQGREFADLTVIDRRKELFPIYRAWGYEEYGRVDLPDEFRSKLLLPCTLVRMSKRL